MQFAQKSNCKLSKCAISYIFELYLLSFEVNAERSLIKLLCYYSFCTTLQFDFNIDGVLHHLNCPSLEKRYPFKPMSSVRTSQHTRSESEVTVYDPELEVLLPYRIKTHID